MATLSAKRQPFGAKQQQLPKRQQIRSAAVLKNLMINTPSSSSSVDGQTSNLLKTPDHVG